MPAIDQNSRRRRPTGLLALDETAAHPGHTLYAPLTGTGEVYLVDLRGETVHQWNLPYRPGRHARLLADGTLAYNGVLPGEDAPFPMWHKYRGGVMLHAAPDGTVLREHRDPLQHHDAHHLDDGRILYTALEPLRAPTPKPYAAECPAPRPTAAPSGPTPSARSDPTANSSGPGTPPNTSTATRTRCTRRTPASTGP
ncbi:hypothetical protein [Streptomyces sp. NPDC055632]